MKKLLIAMAFALALIIFFVNDPYLSAMLLIMWFTIGTCIAGVIWEHGDKDYENKGNK